MKSMFLQKIFGGNQARLENDFRRTLSEKITINDRVRHRKTGQLGTVIQTGKVEGSLKLPAISVKHDDGSEAWLVPSEDYTKATRY
jgi:hypothetical protein